MARRVDSRLRIRCTLVARTPLHVGGMGADVDTDLALAVNGAGDFYVPGTSLSGALRGWLMSSV
ncbi:MAG TPA: RAMP superfamily CRISPR-associated protein, partial [Blastocatellia bacterium]|nr:RAMP superfamily CRISPR-associated protein [Blastocatellia bacterium]